tara:strand:+ start:8609 stop:8770 length:162 start_codon:yes stop_codon:yes gene_type:complete
MNNTTIALSNETKKILDPIREKLCQDLDTRISYSYAIKHLIQKNNVLEDGRTK